MQVLCGRLCWFLGVLFISLFLTHHVSADVIELKSGLIIDGTIVEQKDDYIRVDNGERIYKIKIRDLVKKTADYLRRNPIKEKQELREETLQNILQLRPNHYLEDFRLTEEFRQQIIWLFFEENFKELEDVASVIRSQKSRFNSGDYRIFHYYDVLKSIGDEDDELEGRQAYIRSLERWGEKIPESFTQKVLLAEAYTGIGWMHNREIELIREDLRNNDMPDPDELEEKRERIKELEKLTKESFQKAYDLAQEAHTYDKRDPHLYSVMIDAATGLGLPNEKFFEALQGGQAIWADYSPLYEKLIIPFSTEWYGQVGDAEQMGETIVSMFGKKKEIGEMMYAQMAGALLQRIGDTSYKQYNFSWDVIRRGYTELLKRYEYGFYHLNMFTRFACLYDDINVAKELFLIIADNWDGHSERAWGSVDYFIKKKNEIYSR